MYTPLNISAVSTLKQRFEEEEEEEEDSPECLNSGNM
jgi:hypothetical protein